MNIAAAASETLRIYKATWTKCPLNNNQSQFFNESMKKYVKNGNLFLIIAL